MKKNLLASMFIVMLLAFVMPVYAEQPSITFQSEQDLNELKEIQKSLGVNDIEFRKMQMVHPDLIKTQKKQLKAQKEREKLLMQQKPQAKSPQNNQEQPQHSYWDF